MTSFFSNIIARLSAGPANEGPAQEPQATEEYQSLVIRAAPEKAGDQWRLAGTIVKREGDTVLERFFLRADTFPSLQEAQSFSLRKGRQIIDERGRRLFADGAQSGRV